MTTKTKTIDRTPETLQLWPNGGNVTFSGDSAPGGKLEIQDDRMPAWRPATEQERHDVHREVMARTYAERDVLCCDSSLVDDLLKLEDREVGAEFCYDEIRGLYPNPEWWTASECRNWIDDNHDSDSYPDESNPFAMENAELVAALVGLGHSVDDSEDDETLAEALLTSCDAGDWGDIGDWRDVVRDNAEPAEIFEWWRVTSWLADKLDEIDEPTISNSYGAWWGRTCTGQGFLMDGTLQAVADRVGC
jgi:hypothetical protein